MVLPSRRVRTAVILSALFLALSAGAHPLPAVEAATALPTPPPGGITVGVAGTSDAASLADAQAFPVASIWTLDVQRQQWLNYIPGAPNAVNTLPGSLTPSSIVMIRRAGQHQTIGFTPLAALSTSPAGDGNALATPPPGGLTIGTAGTNDPARLAARQPFPVASISVLDVSTQRWLTYTRGAPAWAQSLTTGLMQSDSIVTIRRAEDAPTASRRGGGFDAAAEARLLALVNEERTSRGLAPLNLDPGLVTVARDHSRDMWARNFLAHTNPDGLSPFERIRAAGIEYRRAGENIARYATAELAHPGLMASSGHRANILNERFRYIGIGVVESEQGLLITQVFTD